ncbi:hypothetical protein GCK72_008305 [Caenorhabditis remanei]|uniref:Uncharacterized protein n=1 Tax=Caenorhabditis remanei TaxID=31234 RepID=A0A6A5GZE0_CAERE|nr:hypothetical protein GCK72_008305 [Caenorhabditis remanei]KAF1760059.1 hypothetical protein GCK72_008305 [Caenorhabditis remanei]
MKSLIDILRHDTSSQSIDRVVRLLNQLLHRIESNDTHDGTEDLLLGDRHLIFDVGEDRRLHKVSLVAVFHTSSHQLGTVFLSGGDVLQDGFNLENWTFLTITIDEKSHFSNDFSEFGMSV